MNPLVVAWLALVIALTIGWSRYALAVRRRQLPDADARTDLEPGETAAFVGVAHAPRVTTALITAIAIGSGATVLYRGQALAGVAVTATIGTVAVVLSRVETIVSTSQIRVTLGPGRWPRWTYPIHAIRAARPTHVRLTRWAGLGIAGNLRILGWMTISTRDGDALEVDFEDGRRLTISLDQPEPAAGLINGLIHPHV